MNSLNRRITQRWGVWCVGAAVFAIGFGRPAEACELCAVYNAANARTGIDPGWVAGVSDQFIHFGSEQIDGREVHRANPDLFDRSVTHVVAGYNFNSHVGLSANLPLVYRRFDRTDLVYSLNRPPRRVRERGEEFDLGDLSVVGRLTLLNRVRMKDSIAVNLLLGVKAPTGDSDRVRLEVDQARIYDQLAPKGTPHDPLGHSISSVHNHDLAAGSGSVDGLFGLTVSTRLGQWFGNAQAQYSLRTPGESGFEFGDDLLFSGGPGRFLYATERWSVSLQGLFSYETTGRATLEGRKTDRTGMTVWYGGPQLGLTWGSRFSALMGVDLPLALTANGFQAAPSYRVHGGLSVRF